MVTTTCFNEVCQIILSPEGAELLIKEIQQQFVK
ncbi:hypothetical protein [Bacillus anthracis]|nr:hypothetical protein [Bacillus anthracis]